MHLWLPARAGRMEIFISSNNGGNLKVPSIGCCGTTGQCMYTIYYRNVVLFC